MPKVADVDLVFRFRVIECKVVVVGPAVFEVDCTSGVGVAMVSPSEIDGGSIVRNWLFLGKRTDAQKHRCQSKKT